MTHYATLAAIGFRLVAVVKLVESLPGLLTTLRFLGSQAGPQMPLLIFAGIFGHLILAAVLFFCARPLGKFVARGFE